MIIIKEKMSLKKMMIVGLVIFGSIIADSNFNNNSTVNLNEAGFLGTGNYTTYGPCFSPTGSDHDKVRLKFKTFKIFGITVSTTPDGQERC